MQKSNVSYNYNVLILLAVFQTVEKMHLGFLERCYLEVAWAYKTTIKNKVRKGMLRGKSYMVANFKRLLNKRGKELGWTRRGKSVSAFGRYACSILMPDFHPNSSLYCSLLFTPPSFPVVQCIFARSTSWCLY